MNNYVNLMLQKCRDKCWMWSKEWGKNEPFPLETELVSEINWGVQLIVFPWEWGELTVYHQRLTTGKKKSSARTNFIPVHIFNLIILLYYSLSWWNLIRTISLSTGKGEKKTITLMASAICLEKCLFSRDGLCTMFFLQPQVLKHYVLKEYDNHGIWLFQPYAMIVIIITELV